MRCQLLALACLLAVGTPVVYSEPVCAAGWVAYRESCYLFSKDFLTWFQAAAECRKLDAHLVTVNDDLENQFLGNYIYNPAVAVYFKVIGGRLNDNMFLPYHAVTWIGLTDLYVEGSWRWVDTDSAHTYKAWGISEPSNHFGSEHCVHFGGFGLTWNDVNCHFLGTYICEK
jgi:hypothetical protein